MMASMAALATQAAAGPLVDDSQKNLEKFNLVADFPAIESPALSISEAGSVGAAELTSCATYYFHNTSINVGADGEQKITNITAPPAGAPGVIVVQLPLLSNILEIAKFYSDPVLAGNLTISGDLVGEIWVQTNNFNDTDFIAEIFDYNPANGNTSSLGMIEFGVITDGPNEAELIIEPPPVTIPTGHRLLFVLSGKSSNILTRPTVTLFYDSAERNSRFTICQINPPNLTISKSGPVTAIAGQAITYTLSVTNSGGQPATGLVINDTLPAGAGYVSGGTLAGNTVTWSVASLGPGAMVQQTFVVTATGTITNDDYRVTATSNISATGQEAVLTVVSQPGQPNLSISKEAPALAGPGELITYTLTIANGGDTEAENLIISDTIPSGANYVSGGTKSGNNVTWLVASLEPNESVEVSFVVTASTAITNSDYRVTAEDNVSAMGQETVVTAIAAAPSLNHIYLPILRKPGATTLLFINSENTGGINPLRVLDTSNNQLLSCIIGNNVTQSCGSFPAVGTYKLIAHTNNCGVLQGTFGDAAPGATVTRRVYCN
jgi:uncharacterized repeat protein (TIGR01451 family)